MANAQDVGGHELLQAPGQTVASYRDAPVGPQPRAARGAAAQSAEVVGYAIERLEFEQPRSVRGIGEPRSVLTKQAWRVRVYTNNLQVRSAPVSVWIGDKLVGMGIESPDLMSVVAVTTDSSLITSGQPVSISYQDQPDPGLTAKRPLPPDTKP